VLAPEAEVRRSDRAVSIRGSQWLTGVARPAIRHAPALPRPSHPGSRIVTIAKRPFGGLGWFAV